MGLQNLLNWSPFLSAAIHQVPERVHYRSIIHTLPQVSTSSSSSSVNEEKKVKINNSQAANGNQWDRWTGNAVDMKEEVPKPVTVHFVLQESSGYMEPMLCILAILHTVISFFCIIGYYCLKVGQIDEWEVSEEFHRIKIPGAHGRRPPKTHRSAS